MKVRLKEGMQWLAGLVVTAALLLALPQVAFAIPEGELWVNGENIIAAQDNTVTCGTGTATYDPDSNTLTLTNAQITKTNGQSRGIELPANMDLTIELVGENSITTANGVYAAANSDITFSGSGSFALSEGSSAPLVSQANITIDGATLTVTCEKDGAVQVYGDLLITGGGSLTATGTYYGVLYGSDDNAPGSLSVTEGSTLTATSTANDYDNPIWGYGPINISNSTVSASGFYPLLANGDITIADSTVASTSSADWGVWATGNLSIKGNSDVTAIGATGSIGAAGTFTIEPAEAGLIDVFVGPDQDNATLVDDAPLSQTTNATPYTYDGGAYYLYFRSAPHTHAMSAANQVDPTCTTAGKLAYYTCNVCDRNYEDADGQTEIADLDTYGIIEPTGHDHTGAWQTSQTDHWKLCPDCDTEIDRSAHSFEWIIDKEATATEAGSKHEQCSVCGYAKAAVEISATGTTDGKENSTEEGQTDDALPKTGDSINFAPWLAALIASATAIVIALLGRRRSSLLR